LLRAQKIATLEVVVVAATVVVVVVVVVAAAVVVVVAVFQRQLFGKETLLFHLGGCST
jgi:hypothetical protein